MICLFFSRSKLVLQPITNGFVYSTLSLNRVARRLLTICKKMLPTNKTQILDNIYFSIYFMLVAFMSPVKFSNIVFPVWNFVRSLKFYYKTIFGQSLPLKSLEIRLFRRKLKSRKRRNALSVSHRNYPKYSNDQR